MAMSPNDIKTLMDREQILQNSDVSEYLNFIRDQIHDAYDSSDANYFKPLRNTVGTGDTLDQYCTQLLDEIENVYDGIEFDIGEYDRHLDELFAAVYKFFVKNSTKIMYTFLSQYILNTKNRKALTMEYLNAKLPNYPKDQYGKKEYFILMIKLNKIIKDIKREKLSLEEFIKFIKRADSVPMYVEKIDDLLDREIILDNNVVDDMFSMFLESDQYDQVYCKLQMMITENLINPYLEEQGISYMRLPPVEDDELTDEDEENGEDESVPVEEPPKDTRIAGSMYKSNN